METGHPYPPRGRHNPRPQRCVHIRALLGRQVPCVVDDIAPVDLRSCYPPVAPEVLHAAAANPDSLRQLVRPHHVQLYQEALTSRSAASRDRSGGGDGGGSGADNWRRALTKLTRDTFDCAVDSRTKTGGGSPASPGPLPSSDGSACKLQLLEGSVMAMLCRVLQTTDESAVMAWLLHATHRELRLASEIINSSIANKDALFVEPSSSAITRSATAVQRSSRNSTAAPGASKVGTSARSETSTKLSTAGGQEDAELMTIGSKKMLFTSG